MEETTEKSPGLSLEGDELLNTSVPAPLQSYMALASWQSDAYVEMRPYPRYAFGLDQWPAERGKPPTPLPYAGTLLSTSAEFTFRNGPPSFTVPTEEDAGLEPVGEFLAEVIRANRLGERWISLAENCGRQGALAALFTYDAGNERRPVRIDFLDIPQQCRLWFDPIDTQRVLMARIQFPYQDSRTGDWYYYREEWTERTHVTYRPAKAASFQSVTLALGLPDYMRTLGDHGNFEVETTEANPYGVIPVTVIRNRRVSGNPLGEGDLWQSFRLIDRLALALHGEDRASQIHSEPRTVALNADIDDNGPLKSGEIMSVNNSDPDKQADVRLLEPSGASRQYSHQYIDKIESLLFKQAGVSRVDNKEVSNKGNMTALAFSMTFADSISTADRKRQSWGEGGMCLFFAALLQGLAAVGGIKELAAVDEDLTVSVDWPPYFADSPEDLKTITDRTHSQIEAGTLPRRRGAERIARAEKVPRHEIEPMLDELDQQEADRKAEDAANMKMQLDAKTEAAKAAIPATIPPAKKATE